MAKKIVIGHKDIVDFPKINLLNLPVKVDSGAYTSSIHYYKAKEVKEGEATKLKVYFLSPRKKGYKESIFLFDDFSERKVKSSNGISEVRYSIKTKIKLFKKNYTIELTLAKRSRMRYKVLLGRKFLAKKFIIDNEVKNLSYNNNINYYKTTAK